MASAREQKFLIKLQAEYAGEKEYRNICKSSQGFKS